MGTLTRNSYQFDASINIEDSEIYSSIVSDINSGVKAKIGDAINNLMVAEKIINYDLSNLTVLSSKIVGLSNILRECDSLGNKINTGVRIYEEYDSSLKEILDSYLIDGLFNGMEIHFKDDGTVKEMDLDEFFKYFDNNQKGFYYGINQGPFNDIKKTDPEYYEYLRKLMKDKYGFNDDDIDFFMGSIDEAGSCAYARSANDVILAYKDRPDLFEETFGYPLYIKNSEGKMILNATELYIDYLMTSYRDYDGNTIVKYIDGKYVINKEGNIYGNYISIYDEAYKFFDVKTKDSKIPISCHSEEIYDQSMNYDKESLKKFLEEQMASNEGLSMGMCPTGQAHNGPENGPKSVPYYSLETGNVYQMGGGHWITITNITDEGIVVDSWGERFLVKYDDLIKDCCFNIFTTNFETK